MYTVEWHDKLYVWEVVRWDVPVNGVRAGTAVARFKESERNEAHDVCDCYNMEIEQEIYSEFG
jgi:hypothetical protein